MDVKAWPADAGEGEDLGWIVAFVGSANETVAEAQSVEGLGCRSEEGDYSLRVMEMEITLSFVHWFFFWLFGLYSIMFTVRCSLFTVHCSLFTSHTLPYSILISDL